MSLLKQKAQQWGAGIMASTAIMAQAAPPSSGDLVDALQGVFGKHSGARASHAKGVCVQGLFLPSVKALQVTHGPMWSQKDIAVQGRFSVGGGNPKASDKSKTVRGLALHLGKQWDLVLISAPVFMVATPEEFIDFMKARQPDPATGKPDPARVKAFNAATPSTRAQIAYLEKAPIPASYAHTPYWGVNAFTFTNATGEKVAGRWQLQPKAGVLGLTAGQLAELDDDFLLSELQSRLRQGAVVFDVLLQLATEQDNVTDPTSLWPKTNPIVPMGQIHLTAIDDGCDPTMFNPSLLPTGITLSDDPILKVRAGAYGVSLGRRLSR